jgi:hypothetical protein
VSELFAVEREAFGRAVADLGISGSHVGVASTFHHAGYRAALAAREEETREIDRAFYTVTARERDLERCRSDRLERERDEYRARLIKALAQTGELSIGATLAVERVVRDTEREHEPAGTALDEVRGERDRATHDCVVLAEALDQFFHGRTKPYVRCLRESEPYVRRLRESVEPTLRALGYPKEKTS